MTIDTTTADLHRRLERHRRADGVLQSRARPVSHKRSDEQEQRLAYRMASDEADDGNVAAKVIRDVVGSTEQPHDGLVVVAKRLLGNLLGGDDDGDGSSGTSTSNSASTNQKSSSRSGGDSGDDSSTTTTGSSDEGNGSDGSTSSTSSENEAGTGAQTGGQTSSSTNSGNTATEEPDNGADSSTSSSSSLTNSPSSSSSSSSSLTEPGSSTTKGKDTESSSTSSKSSATQSSSSKGGLIGGLLGGSSSSSAVPSSTMTSTLPASTTAAAQPDGTSTSLAYVTNSAATTPSAAAAAATTSAASDDNGPGVGPIIGIVAGSLAGIAVLAVIVTFLFKKFGKREDPYETNPFGHNDLYRASTAIPDDFDVNEGYAPSMSEMQKPHEAGYGYQANDYGNMPLSAGHGTQRSFDSSRPRPPTMLQRRLDHQANFGDMGPMPPFAAGMYGNGQPFEAQQNVSPPMPAMAYMGSNGFDPSSPHYGYLERSGSGTQHHFNNEPTAYANLDRGASLNSGAPYSHDTNGPPVLPALEHQHETAGRPDSTEFRSGTPDLPNVQQTYAAHQQGSSMGQEESANVNHGFASQFSLPPIQGQHMAHAESMTTLPPYSTMGLGGANGSHDDYSQQSEKYREQQQRFQQHQPLQVRNLLSSKTNAPAQESGEAHHTEGQGTSDSAYGGVW